MQRPPPAANSKPSARSTWVLRSAVIVVALGAMALVGAGAEDRATRESREPPGRYFTWGELFRSRSAWMIGAPNEPTPEAEAALRALTRAVLDPLREALGRPVLITSGYRADKVNEAADGAPRSQHLRGEAADLVVPGLGAEVVATVIVALGLPYDQLVWYDLRRGGHVHVSYTAVRPNRREALHAPAGGGYRRWVPP